MLDLIGVCPLLFLLFSMHNSPKTSNTLLYTAMALLVCLCLWVSIQPPAFDTALLDFFATHRSPWAVAMLRAMTWVGSLYVLLPALMMGVYLLYRQRCETELKFLLSGFTTAVMLSYALKYLIARPRPELHPHLTDTNIMHAFPSTHTTQITAFALLVFLLVRQLKPSWQQPVGLLLLLLAMLVAFSRLYLQVHYPLDVVAGVLTGIVAVLLCKRWIAQK